MLVVEAKIISISADILYDDTGGHYLARAVLTEDGEKELSGRECNRNANSGYRKNG